MLKVDLNFIPLANHGFPWVIPALIAFGISFIFKTERLTLKKNA